MAAAQSDEPGDAQEDVACTDCHREHQGQGFTRMETADPACQACHTDSTVFAGEHPPFEAYPHDRRTRINFDHVGHVRRHFPESDAEDVPERCVNCHEPGPRGNREQVKGFEDACAACHAGEIRGEGIAGAAGVAVVVVPGLDLPTLREAQAGIGGWPELSDRELTPFMRAVFAGDPELEDALEKFDRLDPLDLREAGPEDIEAVKAIAWATKTLFHDLIAQGPSALRAKLGAALDRELDEGAAREMLGGIPLATVREAQAEWFPSLFQDVARHRAGQPVPMPASEFAEPAEAETEGGAPEAGQESILGEDAEPSQESILGEDSEPSQESILGEDSEPSQESILGEDSEPGQESILGEDSEPGQESILGEDTEPGQESILGEDTAPGQESILGDDPDTGQAEMLGEEREADEDAAVDAEPPQPNPEEWARLGGWYRDYFALLYRPRDHADGFLKRWLEAAAAADAAAGSIAGPIVERLAEEDAPGKCMKCHSIDTSAGGALSVNWRGKPSGPGTDPFTRFAHVPHLSLLTEEQGCAACHAFDREADYLAGFEDRDPGTFESNFRPITKSACADCHTAERAGNTCVQCHDYHVGHTAGKEATTTIESMNKDESGQ